MYISIYESFCSESLLGFLGFGLENVNKWWEVIEVKIFIFVYKDYRENLNKFKSSKGKKFVWEKIFDIFIEYCKMVGIGSFRSLI